MANGKVIYSGPSLIDGKPIVAVAVVSVTNRKTGIMNAVYILRSDIPPVEAARLGEDRSVCGSCVHRGDGGPGRSCYVLLWASPTVVYDAYKRGAYKVADPAKLDKTLMVRLGAYGDSSAVPREIWERLLKGAPSHTGYSHQMATHPQMKGLCQASVETPEQALYWQARGWKTFRTRMAGEPLMKGERQCPASEEAGKSITCAQCKLCDGQKANISIQIHGAVHIRRNFALNLEKAVDRQMAVV